MSEAYLDTSAVVDYGFKGQAARARVAALLPTGSQPITSRYVLYELARGFLRNLILLHNKSVGLSGYSELVAYAAANYRRPHRLGTILGAYEQFFKEGHQKTPFETGAHTFDEALLLSFRGYLRGAIKRNWKRIQNSFGTIVNDVGCRADIEAPTVADDGLYYQELRTQDCGSVKNCGVKRYVARAKDDFVRLREALQSDPHPDAETTRRIKALRELYRVEKTDFEAKDCYSCGDALIAHEAPPHTAIVTRNQKHFEPICKVFQKPLQSYQ